MERKKGMEGHHHTADGEKKNLKRLLELDEGQKRLTNAKCITCGLPDNAFNTTYMYL